jgi:hypothetical protein
MENTTSYLNKSTILIIFVLFMFSDKLWNISWDIGKSFLIVICILFTLNYLNPKLAEKVKEIISDFINVGSKNNFIMSIFSNIASFIMGIINFIKPATMQPSTFSQIQVPEIITQSSAQLAQPVSSLIRTVENKSLDISNPTNNKRLY